MTTIRSCRILAVDDNKQVLRDLQDIFETTQKPSLIDRIKALTQEAAQTPSHNPKAFRIDVAIQGQQAIDMSRAAVAEHDPYSMAFVDVRMPPGLDGIETIQKLWDLDPNLQVVLATAYSDYSFEQLQKLLVPRDRLIILTKPFEPIEIRQITGMLTAKWCLNRERRERAIEREKLVSELERSNRDLQEFAIVVSHDLRAPLRHIRSQVTHLQQDFKLEEGVKAQMNQVVKATEKMSSMIAGILEYSRIGAKSWQPVLTDLNEPVQQAIVNLASAISQSHATVEVTALPAVICQPIRIVQLFQNLIENAIKYSGDDPPRITIGSEPFETGYKLFVLDRGIGMDPESAECIFKLFHRLHTPQMSNGIGIGLPHCKRIVERHGGRIWVETAPKEGSTFFVYLPTDPNAAC